MAKRKKRASHESERERERPEHAEHERSKRSRHAASPVAVEQTGERRVKTLFSRSYLIGALLATSLIIIIAAYTIGFQYGRLSLSGEEAKGTTGGAESNAPAPEGAKPSTPPPQAVPKSEKPVVELFVMSYCPFGLQMEKAFVPVAKLLGEKADINVRSVSYAMHGLKEVEENTRQYCIQKVAPEKYWSYLECFLASNDAQSCMAAAGIPEEAVERCASDADEEFGISREWEEKARWLNGRFPRYPVDAELNQQYGVRGSPTVVINEKVVRLRRSAEAVKEAVCAAFTTPPPECERELSAVEERPGPGPVGAGGGSPTGAATAGCGA